MRNPKMPTTALGSACPETGAEERSVHVDIKPSVIDLIVRLGETAMTATADGLDDALEVSPGFMDETLAQYHDLVEFVEANDIRTHGIRAAYEELRDKVALKQAPVGDISF
jgi:hypothetical protein